MKVWAVPGFYVLFAALVVGFNVYFRRARGGSFSGSLDFSNIPRKLIWLPIAATIGLLFIIGSSIVFAFLDEVPGWVVPIRFLMSPWIEILAVILVALGLVVVCLSQFQLGASYRILLPEEETELVTVGVYSVCRNPLYVGAYVGLVGVFLLMPNLIFIAAMAIVLINNHFRILEEEKFLLGTFGDLYRSYCSRVGRYGPKVIKLG